MDNDIYRLPPVDCKDGIPVFSLPGSYVENYQDIARSQIETFNRSGGNPFVPVDWDPVEESTRILIRKYARPGDRILDVGAGVGALLAPFTDLERHGMDISIELLKMARDKGLEVCYAMIEDMPYREGLFDLVVCCDVLEHVFDLNLCCARILSVLKPGGHLIVRVPYREDLSAYAEDKSTYALTHLRNFDQNSLRLLFEKIMGCRYLEWTPGGFSYVISKLKYRLWMVERPLVWILKKLDDFFPDRAGRFLARPFYPREINIVFIKP